jgi:hypothetical protein
MKAGQLLHKPRQMKEITWSIQTIKNNETKTINKNKIIKDLCVKFDECQNLVWPLMPHTNHVQDQKAWCHFYNTYHIILDHLCGLMVRVPGCRPKGPRFNSRHRHTFWIEVGLEQSPLSLMRITEELLERKISGPSLENWGYAALATRHPSICKSWH